MSEFKELFGIEDSQVQKTCLLIPFIPKGLLKEFGVSSLSKGRLYAAGNGTQFTLIVTGVGAPLMGDAVLYLEKTSCRRLVFLGACGLVPNFPGLKIGSLVCVSQCFAMESFSRLINNQLSYEDPILADNKLLEAVLQTDAPEEITCVNCATLGSLKLEEKYMEEFSKKNIAVVDMECSAFFEAAKHIQRQAVALLFVTDIVSQKPFYIPRDSRDESAVLSSIKQAAKTFKSFCQI